MMGARGQEYEPMYIGAVLLALGVLAANIYYYCHPLLAAFTDQARLHDTHFALRDSVRFMRERAELFDAMIPGISIDTDAGSGGTRRDFMRYARECRSFGVPDLYVLNPIEDSAVTPEDWEEIREIWEDYRRENGLG